MIINKLMSENVPISSPSSLMSLLAMRNVSRSDTLYHLSTNCNDIKVFIKMCLCQRIRLCTTFYYRPQTKVCEGYAFTRFCLSTGRGEYLGRYPPPGRYNPGRYTPPGRYTSQTGTPHQAGTPPGQVHSPRQVHPTRQVHPLGRYTLRSGTPPRQVHPLAGTPQAGTTPRSSACWEIRATSGRYASYWNAFLF